MSKASDLNDARLQGMAYALNRIREIGAEEFDKEMAWRTRGTITAVMTPQEILENQRHVRLAYDLILRALMIVSLHDEFDFGQQRLDRLFKRYNLKASCLEERYVTWGEIMNLAKDIYSEGLKLS